MLIVLGFSSKICWSSKTCFKISLYPEIVCSSQAIKAERCLTKEKQNVITAQKNLCKKVNMLIMSFSLCGRSSFTKNVETITDEGFQAMPRNGRPLSPPDLPLHVGSHHASHKPGCHRKKNILKSFLKSNIVLDCQNYPWKCRRRCQDHFWRRKATWF